MQKPERANLQRAAAARQEPPAARRSLGRVFRMPLDSHLGFELRGAVSAEHAPARGHVRIVAAHRHADVALVSLGVVRRVEAHPPHARETSTPPRRGSRPWPRPRLRDPDSPTRSGTEPPSRARWRPSRARSPGRLPARSPGCPRWANPPGYGPECTRKRHGVLRKVRARSRGGRPRERCRGPPRTPQAPDSGERSGSGSRAARARACGRRPEAPPARRLRAARERRSGDPPPPASAPAPRSAGADGDDPESARCCRTGR